MQLLDAVKYILPTWFQKTCQTNGCFFGMFQMIFFKNFVDSNIFHAPGGLHRSHEAGFGPTGAARRWERKDMDDVWI